MLIELRNVTKVYGSFPGAFRALDGVSVIVEPGEFVSVIHRAQASLRPVVAAPG